MKIGLLQMTVSNVLEDNLKRAKDQVMTAKSMGAEIAVLPEMFVCSYSLAAMKEHAQEEGGPVVEFMKELAKEANLFLVGGSVPEKEGDRYYNTSYTFSNCGDLIGKYRKIHLFDIDIEGAISFKESDVLSAGDNIVLIDTPYGKIGVVICYDLRFPELIRKNVLKGAQVIIAPSAFNMTTGPAHWELLARARAVDNQVFVALCSPARQEDASYVAYGHSLVASPWGDVMASLDGAENILVVDLSMDQVSHVRKQLPLLNHLRPEVYAK
jgi:omega-amidase